MSKLTLAAVLFLLILNTTVQAQTLSCAGGKVSFVSNLSGTNYQWKIESDSGFVSISDNSVYSGTSSKEMQLINVQTYLASQKFRCLVDGNYSNTFMLNISNEWKGSIDSSWEISGNWSCGIVPDVYTDVIINNTSANPLVINSDVSCRTLNLSPLSVLKINSGFNLDVRISPRTEQLSKQDMAILDSVPSVYIPLDSTFMDDGITTVKNFIKGVGRPQGRPVNNVADNTNGAQKKKLIAKMIERGNYLMDDANFAQYKPDQDFGLVYIPGKKVISKPGQPTQGDCEKEGKAYYGLDCSGFIYEMTKNANLPDVHPQHLFNVGNISDTARWNQAFQKSEYNRLTMVEYSRDEVPVDLLQWGDIIAWDGNHIGMVVGVITKVIYQSNGDFSKPGCENGYNRDEKHGPNMKQVITTPGPGNGWIENLSKGKYKVFRVIEGLFDVRDNQIYLAKKIGKQIWMERNFNFAFPDSYCYENSQTQCSIFGRLYDWNQAKASVPAGWHLPSDSEWETLVTFLGGPLVAGAAMKEKGIGLWAAPNTGANNKTGFNGLPGGNRNTFGTNFANFGIRGFWWSSTINSSNNGQAFNRVLDNESTTVGRGSANRAAGRTHFSVRLIKDN